MCGAGPGDLGGSWGSASAENPEKTGPGKFYVADLGLGAADTGGVLCGSLWFQSDGLGAKSGGQHPGVAQGHFSTPGSGDRRSTSRPSRVYPRSVWHTWVLIYGFSTDRKSSILEGFPAARGRPDPQNRRSPVGPKIVYQKPRCEVNLLVNPRRSNTPGT